MIELTLEQSREVTGPETPALDPRTQEEYVLVRRQTYERLKGLLYDDSPWTAEERDELAWEAGKHAGWDDMSGYDDYPEKRS